MSNVTLGRTGITVHKNGFGALPIQRIAQDDAVSILRRALEHGITYFDTARMYTDSEEKLGHAFAGMRDSIILATKTAAVTAADFWSDLAISLKHLKTDYVDLYQFHNPSFCPKPGDGTGLYEAMLEARAQGKLRFIGITNHRLSVAQETIDSGLYDTLQFPFSYLSGQQDMAIVEACKAKNMGFIAMKALSGGLITNSAAAYAWQDQYPHVLPIWGIQRAGELDQFLSYMETPPTLDGTLSAVIAGDRKQLLGNFCRACAYCMPCPKGIEINTCARMSLLLRRSPSAALLTPEMQAKMRQVEECTHCNSCVKKCPYGLDTPSLLAENWKDYQEILAGKPL